MCSISRRDARSELLPQPRDADVSVCVGHCGVLHAAVEADTPRAHSLLSLCFSLALLRRYRAGVGDVPVPAAMKLAIVAGEASGDLHAAHVLRELRKLDPSVTTFGIGGDLLAAEGMDVMHHAREMGIVGLFNVIRHLGMFRRVFREIVDRIASERPDAVLLVDYPDFNLRLAEKVKALGIRVVYFISPQVWAWRRSRVRHIAKNVDHMVVLFPF